MNLFHSVQIIIVCSNAEKFSLLLLLLFLACPHHVLKLLTTLKAMAKASGFYRPLMWLLGIKISDCCYLADCITYIKPLNRTQCLGRIRKFVNAVQMSHRYIEQILQQQQQLFFINHQIFHALRLTNNQLIISCLSLCCSIWWKYCAFAWKLFFRATVCHQRHQLGVNKFLSLIRWCYDENQKWTVGWGEG